MFLMEGHSIVENVTSFDRRYATKTCNIIDVLQKEIPCLTFKVHNITQFLSVTPLLRGGCQT